MNEVVFVAYARTAFCNRGGSLRNFSGVELAEKCIRGLLTKSELLLRGGKYAVDSIFGGSALPDKLSLDPIRYLTLLLDLPLDTEGHQVEMQCGSGITSINHAAWQLSLGYAEIAIAGGYESYSTVPCLVSTNVEPWKGQPVEVLKTHLSPFPEQDLTAVESFDLLAQKWKVSRMDCDEFALSSREKYEAACKLGLIGDEIIDIVLPATKKTQEIIIGKDDPALKFSPEKLHRLEPLLEGGVSTEGNTPACKDGAAFVLMMTAEKARELGYVPFAKWIAGADAGVEPKIMGIAPVYSSLKALKTAGLNPDDIDVWECREASAAQNLSVLRELESQAGFHAKRSKWNPTGGAIAIGDPNSASGVRSEIYAMKQLEKSGGKYALITSCCLGGQGTTTIIENLRR